MKLIKDNNAQSPQGTIYEKSSVEIAENELAYELKQFFHWRKGNFVNRYQTETGSHKHDAFINYLIDLGY